MTAAPVRSYTVVGAGAIGGTLAAYLDRSGARVAVIDADAEHIAAIRAHGIRIERPDGVVIARVPAYTLEDAPVELGGVLLAVKAQATEQAAAWIAERLAPDGWVASLQNGLNEAAIARAVGAERTVAAFVDLFADVVAPGVIRDGGMGSMALGEFSGGPSERVHHLAADLHEWGTPVVTENVAGFLWSKLAFGTMLAASALADEDMHELIDRHRDVMHALAAEVLAVSDAEAVAPEAFDAFEPAAYRASTHGAARDAATDRLVQWLSTQPKKRSGIHRDIAVRKRPTEVPTLYRPVIALADTHGIAVPHLQALLAALAAVEAGGAMCQTRIAELKGMQEQ